MTVERRANRCRRRLFCRRCPPRQPSLLLPTVMGTSRRPSAARLPGSIHPPPMHAPHFPLNLIRPAACTLAGNFHRLGRNFADMEANYYKDSGTSGYLIPFFYPYPSPKLGVDPPFCRRPDTSTAPPVSTLPPPPLPVFVPEPS